MLVNNIWVPDQIGTPDMQHHIRWSFQLYSEFLGLDAGQDEYYQTSEEAEARIQELLFHTSREEHDMCYLKVEWLIDTDDIEPLYREFKLFIPDRG